MKRALRERGLWLERGFVLERPTKRGRLGSNSEGGCCARRVLEFRNRSTGPSCSFLPKQLNFRKDVEQNCLQGDAVGATNRLRLGLQEACLGNSHKISLRDIRNGHSGGLQLPKSKTLAAQGLVILHASTVGIPILYIV